MSCDWYDGSSQQLRGRTRQRSIQGRPRRLNTTSPPKFSTNSSKVACKVYAPYYANKVSRRSLLHNETLDYNKAFAGKPATLAVAELCGDSRDWACSSGASANSSSCGGNNLCADDLTTQLAISDAVHEDDDALLRNLYGDHPAVELKMDMTEPQEQDYMHDFALPMPPRIHMPQPQLSSMAALQPSHRSGTSQFVQHAPFHSTVHNRASTSQLPPNHPDLTFPMQSAGDNFQPHLMASMHLWPRAMGLADSAMTQDPNMSVYNRQAQLCDALASYSQMFSASWMPQMATVPTVQEEHTVSQERGAVEEENADEDYEHLSQMSEQDWFDIAEVNDDDYVLV